MTLPEQLRAAAAWIRLAATKLECSDEGGARDCMRMGLIGIESERVKLWLDSSTEPPETRRAP